jgi:hypothetical protein
VHTRDYSCFAADAFFKAAIALLAEVPKMLEIDGKIRPTDSLLVEFISNFISTLLVVPVRLLLNLFPTSSALESLHSSKKFMSICCLLQYQSSFE